MCFQNNSPFYLFGVFVFIFIGCVVGLQNSPVDPSTFQNYASAANGATVEVSHKNRSHPSETLINGIKDSAFWNDGEGWETHFQGWINRRMVGGYRRGDGLGGTAMGWVIIRFPEPKRLNRVLVYTVDSAEMPARRYGVRDIWLQCMQPTGEWLTVDRVGKTKKQSKNIIYDNASGVIGFHFKPVTTDKIRVAILSTNEMKRLSGYSWGDTRRQEVEGTIRLLEIEAYGFERVNTAVATDSQEPSVF